MDLNQPLTLGMLLELWREFHNQPCICPPPPPVNESLLVSSTTGLCMCGCQCHTRHLQTDIGKFICYLSEKNDSVNKPEGE